MLNLDKNLLIKLLVWERKTFAEVSIILNCSKITVREYCKKYKIYDNIKSYWCERRGTKNLIDMKFGKLLVISRAKSDAHGKVRWNCLCDCGRTKIINGQSLTRNLSKSCGYCYKKIFKGYKDISGVYLKKLKRGADSRSLVWKISAKNIWDIYLKQNGKCAISGVEIKFHKNMDKHALNTASVDRIDNTKGYIKSNIQIVHKKINYMRGKLTVDEFIELCYLVSKNNEINK